MQSKWLILCIYASLPFGMTIHDAIVFCHANDTIK